MTHLMMTTYPEEQLLTNGASVLLHGSTDAERRAWVEECSGRLGEPLHTVTEKSLSALLTFFDASRKVVFVPDVAALGPELQRSLVTLLRERDERPKLVLGLVGALSTASSDGRLRDDLAYVLRRGHLNLAQADVKSAIAERRAKSPPPAPILPAKSQSGRTAASRTKKLR